MVIYRFITHPTRPSHIVYHKSYTLSTFLYIARMAGVGKRKNPKAISNVEIALGSYIP